MDCFEKIERCHSMNFEDYSFGKKLEKRDDVISEEKDIEDEDPGYIALTFYHF